MQSVWIVVSNPPERAGDDGWIVGVRRSDGMLLYIERERDRSRSQ